jgi:hypothetical protein
MELAEKWSVSLALRRVPARDAPCGTLPPQPRRSPAEVAEVLQVTRRHAIRLTSEPGLPVGSVCASGVWGLHVKRIGARSRTLEARFGVWEPGALGFAPGVSDYFWVGPPRAAPASGLPYSESLCARTIHPRFASGSRAARLRGWVAPPGRRVVALWRPAAASINETLAFGNGRPGRSDRRYGRHGCNGAHARSQSKGAPCTTQNGIPLRREMVLSPMPVV